MPFCFTETFVLLSTKASLHMHIVLTELTVIPNGQPGLWWLSFCGMFTLVETFVRHGHCRKGHASCRLSPNENVIFVELCREIRSGFSVVFFFVGTDKCYFITYCHRKCRALQDHNPIWKQNILSLLLQTVTIVQVKQLKIYKNNIINYVYPMSNLHRIKSESNTCSMHI